MSQVFHYTFSRQYGVGLERQNPKSEFPNPKSEFLTGFDCVAKAITYWEDLRAQLVMINEIVIEVA